MSVNQHLLIYVTHLLKVIYINVFVYLYKNDFQISKIVLFSTHPCCYNGHTNRGKIVDLGCNILLGHAKLRGGRAPANAGLLEKS